MIKPIALTLLLSAGILFPVFSHAAPTPEAKQESKQESAQRHDAPAPPRASVTRHKARIGGKEIAYTATAGELPVLNDAGETEAGIFYVAYSADRKEGAPPRPLMFVFNGGPGAASVWLHLGALGPRRVRMLPDGNMPPPPFELADNLHSWLDLADLVFVDPVGTGYSRAAKADLAKKFSAVQGDVDALGRFVRLYLTRNGLWNAPLYLVGESYGTFRCAALADNLAEHGVALNGLVFISSVLNLQTISFDFGNDLPYQLILPSYTATAWYHGKLAPDLQGDLDKALAQAEEWAGTEYQQALSKGERLTPQERRRVAEKLGRFTGLGADLFLNRDLRVENRDFARELLRDEGRMVGIMDSRFNAENPEPAKLAAFDATVPTIRPPFTAAANGYLRDELGYRSDLEYYTLGGGIGRWDWEAKNSYADTSENLRDAMVKNRYLRVFVASGVFDLATPHFATEYTMAHLGIREPGKRIELKRYRSGHMMYLEERSLAQLKEDVAGFVERTLKAKK